MAWFCRVWLYTEKSVLWDLFYLPKVSISMISIEHICVASLLQIHSGQWVIISLFHLLCDSLVSWEGNVWNVSPWWCTSSLCSKTFHPQAEYLINMFFPVSLKFAKYQILFCMTQVMLVNLFPLSKAMFLGSCFTLTKDEASSLH